MVQPLTVTSSASTASPDDPVIKLAYLETALRAFRAFTTEIVCALKRERNATIPDIHKLPNEVLVDIVRFTRDDNNIHRDVRQLVTVAQVCKLWNTLVGNSPRLWDRITSLNTKAANQLCIRKSSTAPLTVEFRDKPPHGLFGDAAYRRVALSSTSRWKALRFRVEAPQNVVVPSSFAPSTIEVLDVSFLHGRAVAQSVVTIEGTAPFKHVILDNARLDWTSPRFSHLSSLHLSSVDLGWSLHLIGASPGLEILSFQNIYHETDTHILPTELPIIHLPKLTVLAVQDVDASTISALLVTMFIPNIRRLLIESIPPSWLSEPPASLFKSVIEMFDRGSEVKISGCDRYPHSDQVSFGTVDRTRVDLWRKEPNASGVHLGFTSQSRSAAILHLEQMSKVLGSLITKAPVKLDVGARGLAMPRQPYSFPIPPNVLLNLPTLSKIKAGWDVHPQPLIDHLAFPVSGNLLCPSLVKIEFHRVAGVDVTRFLEQRGGQMRDGIWTKA